VSDQDFFFDEDEKGAEKPPKTASKQPTKSTPSKAAKTAPAPSGGIELTWTVTALVGIVALLLGVIIGYAIPKGTQEVSVGAPSTTQEQQAPQLSPEQLSSGQLPPGHPSVGGSTGATGSATTTGN